jgi:hypothetical protein
MMTRPSLGVLAIVASTVVACPVPKPDPRKGTPIRTVGSSAGGVAENAERCRRRLHEQKEGRHRQSRWLTCYELGQCWTPP